MSTVSKAFDMSSAVMIVRLGVFLVLKPVIMVGDVGVVDAE